jgi:hypothetical protein
MEPARARDVPTLSALACPASHGESRTYDLLAAAADALAAGDTALAARLLGTPARDRYTCDASEAMAAHLFTSALARRLRSRGAEDPSAPSSLYLAPFRVPQLRLFELATRVLPSVGAAVNAATDTLIRECAAARSFTLIDVGVGDGRQAAQVVRGLAARRDRPRRVTIVGIEPSAESLAEARRALARVAYETGVEVAFVGVHGAIESLSDRDWRRIDAVGPGAVINASFALHSVQPRADVDTRDVVLRRLRLLEPAVLVVTEADVDHAEPDIGRRFRNCWAHFAQTFALLDDLDVSPSEGGALKVHFLGREIEDILATPEGARCVRHERLDAWEARFTRTGFAVEQSARVVHEGVSLTGVLVGRPAEGHSGVRPVPRLEATAAGAVSVVRRT